MDEDQFASSNVVDIGSRSIAARERKYDELMASMYSDSRESLKLLSALVSQHEPEKADHWVTFYFGWIVTQDLVRAIKQTGYEEIRPLKSFCLGLAEALQGIATEVRRRFENASEKTEVNPPRKVWYQLLVDQTSEAFESPQDELMICGEIGFFGLTDWWLTEFNERERNEIERISDAHTGRGELTRMKIASIQGVLASPVGFLTKLASWFPNAADFHIAKKILDKAESSISDELNVLAKDAFYREKIKHYYKQRDRHPAALGIAIEACEQQIELSRQAATTYLDFSGDSALPWHHGFKQLAIIREKERDYESAIALAERAKEEGWGGDWEKRIARCRKRLRM
jgi:tetratricopeptide (TPR) repeat protein